MPKETCHKLTYECVDRLDGRNLGRDQISAIFQKSHRGIFEIPDPVRYRYRIPILYFDHQPVDGQILKLTDIS